MSVHPTAIIAPDTILGQEVEVGPYAVVGPRVTLGDRCRVEPHALIEGPTVLGPDNRIGSKAVIGSPPQDVKFNGEETVLTIGRGNIFREFVTVNRGTKNGGGSTKVGDHNLLMAYAHIGHDCHLGSHCVVANMVQLAGHVTLEDYAYIGGLAAIHQFVRVGHTAFVAAGSMVSLDIPPFARVAGDRARLMDINSVGLRRRGVSEEALRQIEQAYRLLFRQGLPLAEALERVKRLPPDPEVMHLHAFLSHQGRGPCRPRASREGEQSWGEG